MRSLTHHPNDPPAKELTFEERATWGTCPVCSAPHGEWCHAEIGFQLGSPAGGGQFQRGDGAHLQRLSGAPIRARLVPA